MTTTLPTVKTVKVSVSSQLPSGVEMLCSTSLDNLLACCKRRFGKVPEVVYHLENDTVSRWYAKAQGEK